MNQERLIAAEDITFRYQKDADRPALDHVSFHVSKGEWLAIVGHNGSGKSTLARALNGLILPDEGSIKVGGIKLTEETVWDVRKKVGMVFHRSFKGTGSNERIWDSKHIWRRCIVHLLHSCDGNHALHHSFYHHPAPADGCCAEVYRMV